MSARIHGVKRRHSEICNNAPQLLPWDWKAEVESVKGTQPRISPEAYDDCILHFDQNYSRKRVSPAFITFIKAHLSCKSRTSAAIS